MSAQEARQGHLRLIECVSCAAYLDELRVAHSTMESQKAAVDAMAARIAQLEDGDDLRYAEKELRKLRRTIGKLNAELARARKEHPSYAQAQELFDYWRTQIGKPRAKLTEDREKALLKALEQYTPREIAVAILGAKVAAFRDERGVLHNDVELICRGRKLEAFIDRYQAWRLNQGWSPVVLEPPEPPASM